MDFCIVVRNSTDKVYSLDFKRNIPYGGFEIFFDFLCDFVRRCSVQVSRKSRVEVLCESEVP